MESHIETDKSAINHLADRYSDGYFTLRGIDIVTPQDLGRLGVDWGDSALPTAGRYAAGRHGEILEG